MTTVRWPGGRGVVGEGAAVVMIHGLGGTSNMFQPQMAALPAIASSGSTCRAPAGRRAVEPLTIELMSEAVSAPWPRMGVNPAHFVGHSMGTLICQQIAARSPHSLRRSRCSARARTGGSDQARAANRARLARSGGIADIADQIVANAISAHTGKPRRRRRLRARIHTRQDPESYARTCEALAKATAVDHRLIVPTLLVTGDADAVGPAGVGQALADKIKGARFSSLDRCGHWATVRKPARKQPEARRFFETG